MNASYFQKIPEYLQNYLSQAKYSIQAAVCWFSHRDIFEVLLERLRAGVQVDLLLEYDSQNIRDDGLDFQQFVRAGGQLWACREAGLMHHKFAIVDGQLLLTGSFNWTYNSNAENLIATEEATILSAFRNEFELQKVAAQRIFQVRRADVKVFAAFPLFEKTQFPLTDLRKKVSRGANVWLVRLDKLKMDRRAVFAESSLPFDPSGLLTPFWTAYRMWDEELFEAEMERLKPEVPDRLVNNLRCWTRRMKMGDLIFAIGKLVPQAACPLLAIGIIQSHPEPFAGEGFSSFRAVHWLKIMEEDLYFLPEKTAGQAVARYRGSALRVLQEVFGQRIHLDMHKIDLEKLLQARQPKDIDELNQILQEEMHRLNDASIPEFCGVSPNQMRFLLHDPFADGSPFGFRDFDPAVLDGCPFFLLAEDMLRQTVLNTNPFKLTASTAALPVKVVKALYERLTLKDEWIEKGISNLYKETDCHQIHVCKIVLEEAGIVRKQHGKWLLTKKGQKLSQPPQRTALFQEIFKVFTLKYNWAYLDGYAHPQAGQMAFAFSLSMVAHFGCTERPMAYYAQKYLDAYPMLLEEIPTGHWDNPERHLISCFNTRFFNRFAEWWGLAELAGAMDISNSDNCPVRKGKLLDEVFRMPRLEG